MVTTPYPVPSRITIGSFNCLCDPKGRSSINLRLIITHIFFPLVSSHSVPPPSQHQLALVSALPPPASRKVKEKEKDRPPPSPLGSAPSSSSPQPPSGVPLPDPQLSASASSTIGSE